MVSKKKKKPVFPCSVCRKNVNNNHLAIFCTHCNHWSHNICNNIDKKQYRLFQLNPDLTYNCIKCNEDIIPFMRLNDYESESKLKDDPVLNISITGYSSPISTYTEANKGGAMIYVASDLNFKSRKDLEIYVSKQLESTFIEIINHKESNDIIGVIYRHPCMDTTQFTDDKFSELTTKLSLERNKNVYITGDFNFDLLKISDHSATSNFYDKVTSNLLIPLITLPTKINNKNNTLIDNIFTNQFNPDIISGNFTVNISDHLPSFMITPRGNQMHLPKKHNIYTRELNNFDRENFLMDILAVDWDSSIIEDDANLSFNLFLDTTNKIIDKYMPLKKMSNREFKRRYKPWITNGILNLKYVSSSYDIAWQINKTWGNSPLTMPKLPHQNFGTFYVDNFEL